LSGILLAGCQPFYEEGFIIQWNYSYLWGSCDFSQLEIPFDPFPMVWYQLPDDPDSFPPQMTVDELIDLLVTIPTNLNVPCSGIPTDVALYLNDSHGTRVVPDDSTLAFIAGITETTSLYFGPAPKNGEIVRLTLFGYVDDGGSCVRGASMASQREQ
jgi:hypothetical protein